MAGWAVRPAAGHLLLGDVNNIQSLVIGEPSKVIHLAICFLAERRDPRINGGTVSQLIILPVSRIYGRIFRGF